VYDSFLWPDPAQLRVRDEVAPCLAPVGDEGGERAALDAVGDVVDGFADDVVATADGEGLFEAPLADAEKGEKRKEEVLGEYHAVPGELRVGLQDAVCGGVVAGCVHGI